MKNKGHYSAIALLILGVACLAVTTLNQTAKGRQQMSRDWGLSAERPAGKQEWGKLPLRFEANEGQANPAAQFVARGPGYSVLLNRGEMTLVMQGKSGKPMSRFTRPKERLRAARERAAQQTTVRMELEGINRAARAEGLEPLPTRTNYLVGNDPREWHRNVANFGRVRYRNVYPGVDMIYYGKGGRLEYDLVVAPGADTDAIRMQYAGVESERIDADGALVLGVNGSEVRQLQPQVYQTVDGAERTVEARYVLRGSEVGVALGAYDHGQTLVIDPSLTFSTYFGGAGDDATFGVAVDGFDDVFVTGLTTSTGLGTTGSFQQNLNGALDDAFVLQIDPTGTTVVWCTYLGGTAYDEGDAIAVDTSGNVYVGGITASADFPTTVGSAQKNYAGLATTANGFLAKLDPTGSTLMYATYLGGGGPDGVNDLTIDSSGNVYATGFTLSGTPGSLPKFPTTAGVVQPNSGGTRPGGDLGDAFVTKLSPTGSTFVYSTYLGGSDDDQGWSVQVDGSGDAFIAGETESSNFPTTAGVIQRFHQTKTVAGSSSGWVAELNPTATTLLFGTYLAGKGNDYIFDMVLGSTGNIFVTGATTSTNFPTTSGAVQRIFGGGSGFGDAFVAELKPNGSALPFSTYLGGNGSDAGAGIRVNQNGLTSVVGFTSSTNFKVTANAAQSTLKGTTNAFVAKLRAGGSLILYATYFGGSGADEAQRIEVDSTGHGIITGSTTSVDFPVMPNPGAVQTTFGGGPEDAYIASFDLTVPQPNFMPPSLVFPGQTVGTTSAPMIDQLTNFGDAPMIITAIVTTGDFAQTNTCGTLPITLNPNVSCNINVTFTPTKTGTRFGKVTFTDNAPGSPHKINLTGTGM